MAKHIKAPTQIEAEGNKKKIIEEFFGKVNTDNSNISIAKMKSSPGWGEPGQTPESDEFTLVLNGYLKVENKDKIYVVEKGEAIIVKTGEWVKYSSPEPEGAEYRAACLPAFSPDTVHRDE